MSAARFREAAKVLRERADMATEGHIWHAALGGTVEVCCECGTARKNTPEPDTLVEALDALPEGTVVRLGDGSRYRKNREGNWGWVALKDPVARTTGWIAEYAPVGIESVPGEDANTPKPELGTVTVTLPRSIYDGTPDTLREYAATLLSERHYHYHYHPTAKHILTALADALDAANRSQS